MINELIDELESSVSGFASVLKPTEKRLYAHVLTMLKELELFDDGSIKNNLENIKQVGRIKKELENIILSPGYTKSVGTFLSSYSVIQDIQNEYFATVTTKFSPKKVLDEIKKQAINDTAELLTENGINSNVLNPIKNILNTNITSGGSYSSLTEQLREEILGTKEIDGKLSRYASQIATDSINTYSATYTQSISNDLGLTWFRYTGSLLKTSRPFCVAMVKKSYVHVSEFKEILKGNIDGVKVSLAGLKPNTTPDNFPVLRGGFSCGHQLVPISEASVPDYAKSKVDKPVPVLDAKEQKQYDSIEKDSSLRGQNADLQDRSIREFVTNKEELVNQYLSKNGNVINTDEARKQFIDIGYNGTNAQAVHEASSALGKEALKKLVEEGTEGRVSFYAGGAGSCKTSTIETLRPGIKASSDAIIDGNLSSYTKAAKKFDEYLGMGKDIELAYVWREPEDAWNAVIQRMLNNKSEMGRAVRSSTFIETTKGSYETVARIMENKKLLENPKFTGYIFDNSLGKGNARWMDIDKFKSIKFDSDSELMRKLKAITDGYYSRGEITRSQYETLIQ